MEIKEINPGVIKNLIMQYIKIQSFIYRKFLWGEPNASSGKTNKQKKNKVGIG